MFYSLAICKEFFQIEMFFQSTYTTMSNNSLYKYFLENTLKKKTTTQNKKMAKSYLPLLLLLSGHSWDAYKLFTLY